MQPIFRLLHPRRSDEDQRGPAERAGFRSAVANRQWPQARLFSAGLSESPLCQLCLAKAAYGRTPLSDAELARVRPLIEEGGFIAYCDHRVPPNVSLEHYLFYTQKTRERWGRGVNLNPMADEAIALCGAHAR